MAGGNFVAVDTIIPTGYSKFRNSPLPDPIVVPWVEERMFERIAEKFTKGGAQTKMNEYYEQLKDVTWPVYDAGTPSGADHWLYKTTKLPVGNPKLKKWETKAAVEILDRVYMSERINQNPQVLNDEYYSNNKTAFTTRWMRATTMGYLYQARGILVGLGYRFQTQDKGENEKIWLFWKDKSDGSTDRVAFTNLKGNYFTFDVFFNGRQSPIMTMNPLQIGEPGQGVPMSMAQKNFAGYLSPVEALLYKQNWEKLLSTMRTGMNVLLAAPLKVARYKEESALARTGHHRSLG